MAETIKIGSELESMATGKVVAAASAIKDKTKNKYQDAINTEVSTIITRHENEIHGTGGIDDRLDDLEAMEQIVIDGGDAQIAQGSDFTNPDATKRAKVPTVGAIVDGLNDGIYDVSKRNPSGGPNSDGKFTLDYILANADTLIPTGWRHGGMTISFVHTYDNNYVKFFCTAQNFTTDVSQWQGVDDEPTAGSKNIVKSEGVDNSIITAKAIGNYGVYPFGHNNLDNSIYCKRLIAGSTEESSIGNRVKIGFFLPDNSLVNIQLNDNNYNIGAGIWGSSVNAMISSASNIIQGYNNGEWVGTTITDFLVVNKGFLNISVRNATNTAITDAELDYIKNNIIIDIVPLNSPFNVIFAPSNTINGGILPNIETDTWVLRFSSLGGGGFIINKNQFYSTKKNGVGMSVSLYQEDGRTFDSAYIVYDT